MKHLKRWLLGLVIVAAFSACGCASVPDVAVQGPVLSDYPELFKEQTIIVVGENVLRETKAAAHYSMAPSEYLVAKAIASQLEHLPGEEPAIISDANLSDGQKANHNLILIGVPDSNSVLGEIYGMTNATVVTEEYPGEDKAVLEIMENPWAYSRLLLIVSGSNERSIRIGGMKLIEDEEVRVLQEAMTVTDNSITITGYVTGIGSMPFAVRAIATNYDENYEITGDKELMEELSGFHSPVRIQGYLVGSIYGLRGIEVIEYWPVE